MGRYCYGTFLTVLSLCSPRNTTNKYLCGTMFLSVNSSYDIRDDDGTVGHLRNCTNNISPEITENIASADAEEIYSCFEREIIPMLYPEKQKHVVAALLDIVLRDDNIDDNCSIGVLNPRTKEDYRFEFEFSLAEFLTDFFIFSINGIPNHQGKENVAEITKKFIDMQNIAAGNINLIPRVVSITPTLPKTLRAKDFKNVFTPVAKAAMGLKSHEELKIFMLKIENNEFTYRGMKKLLNSNIGRYVFSRITMEQYRKTDDLESVGGEAAQYIREHATGNELADMLVYVFLEEVLNAPKLMSAIELGNADNKCSGIHFYNVPGVIETFQLVYGASNIEGTLKSAIDDAFSTIEKLKQKRLTGDELVNSASFNRSIDMETARQIKAVVIPQKAGKNPPDTAFGVFLGYSIDLDPEDYVPEEYPDIVKAKMEKDIQEHAVYIYKKIKSLRMGMHSFYIYVLPFNNAELDREDIITQLIGGAAE